MANFGWLHLTDLHVGQRQWLWPRMEETFFRDLDRLHSASGPWDFVFFTGDLVQTGSESEFQILDQLLNRLWLRLRSLGSNPVLLAVPGNHDLVRPSALGSDLGDIADWHDQPSVRSRFWRDSTSDSRDLVNRAFENYTAWWRRTPFRPPAVVEGMLPGDISFTFEKNGIKIGVLGLNTTFLQLAGGDYRGKLDMHSLQFHDACAGNGPEWANQHHLCILMTHQPPNWLTAEGREHLDGEIAVPGQFAVHLFGHQHDSRHDVLSQGGATPRVYWQGISLFGLDDGGVHGAPSRLHGYSAGRIEFMEERRLALSFWPRQAYRTQSGALQIQPDTSFERVDGLRTAPIYLPSLQDSSVEPDVERTDHAEPCQTIEIDHVASDQIDFINVEGSEPSKGNQSIKAKSVSGKRVVFTNIRQPED